MIGLRWSTTTLLMIIGKSFDVVFLTCFNASQNKAFAYKSGTQLKNVHNVHGLNHAAVYTVIKQSFSSQK